MSDCTYYYYTVLSLPETATQAEIEQKYSELNAAYRVLSDSTLRSSYDQLLALQREQRPSVTSPSRPSHEPEYPDLQLRPQTDESGLNWGALAVIVFLLGFWYQFFIFVFYD
jgi:curved DNA-binding protein CbpA